MPGSSCIRSTWHATRRATSSSTPGPRSLGSRKTSRPVSASRRPRSARSGWRTDGGRPTGRRGHPRVRGTAGRDADRVRSTRGRLPSGTPRPRGIGPGGRPGCPGAPQDRCVPRVRDVLELSRILKVPSSGRPGSRVRPVSSGPSSELWVPWMIAVDRRSPQGRAPDPVRGSLSLRRPCKKGYPSGGGRLRKRNQKWRTP